MENTLQVPDHWTQCSRPSPWSGMRFLHVITPETELECELPSQVCISINTRTAKEYEVRGRGGRWHRFGLNPWDISIIPADRPDALRWKGETESLNLLIDTAWLAEKAEVPSVHAVFDRPAYSVQDEISVKILKEIRKDNELAAPFGLTYSESLALALLFRLSAIVSCDVGEPMLNRNAVKINRALEFIDQNLDSAISLGDVATAAGFEGNLHAFQRNFKSCCGESPHKYILDQRLRRAKALLQTGRFNVTEAALATGFSNLSHFSDAFKGRWGAPPSTFLARE